MANRCLYCGGSPNSVEHPLPAAFGEFEGAPLLQERLCRDCNTRLGLLDEQFARSGPEGFLRRYFGIRGRGAGVSPFERGSAGASRLSMKSVDDNLGCEILLEVESGVPRQMCQIVFIKEGVAYHIPLRKDMMPERLRLEYEKLGISKPDDVRFVASDDEEGWVVQLLKEVWPEIEMGVTGELARNYNGAVVDIRVTNRYFRAIAKVAFHYFLTQFPEYTGAERIFDDIRSFITNEQQTVDGANEFVGERELPLIGDMLAPGTRPQGWRGHFLAAERKDGTLLGHVQMFISEELPAKSYTVTLGHAKDRDGGGGHLYVYFVDGPQGRFSGAARELRWARSELPSKPLRPVVQEPHVDQYRMRQDEDVLDGPDQSRT